ncbi:MAG: HAMP domain-containing sensor histidine kinase, partial [Bacteroidota bacterium]
ISFKDIINDTIESYDYMENAHLLSKEINLEIKCPFYSDQNRLKMIFRNILSNAIKYANHYQDNPFIKINITTDLYKAKITISDNGIGIPKMHISNIFDMFYKANADKKGSGLGLFIVKEAVERLMGNIDVNSVEGEGTTFSLSLPNMLAVSAVTN